MNLTIGSLFSGIGGLELGLERSGLGHTVWQVEQSPWARQVLAKHWPQAERYEDVKTVGAGILDPVDVICGGFPCQDVSSAGKGAGLAGSRSGLWYEFARIVGELKPHWVVIENVASGARKWVDAVSAGMGQLGYGVLPVPLSASDVGAPHRRARVFLVCWRVAHTDGCGLRQQPGRSGRASGPHPLLAARPSEKGVTRDSHGHREPTLPEHGQASGVRGVASDPPHWAAAPEFRGMDDGVPLRVDRLHALGNAVVPQCAEVIGHIVQELDNALQ